MQNVPIIQKNDYIRTAKDYYYVFYIQRKLA